MDSMDSENQDATKVTSALAESRISFMKMMTLDICMVVITMFSMFHLSVLPVL